MAAPPTAAIPTATANPQTHISINNTGTKPVVHITLVSDFNCPWCYVAHKEVQLALSQVRVTRPQVGFVVEYRPFELDPTLPGGREKPMCRIACYKAKFGEQKLKQVSEVLKQRGQAVGIDFHWAGKTRQTTNAHRLALKAWLLGGEEAQTKMVEALFRAYFEQETDIGCYDFLSRAAESTGIMTAEQAKSFLQSEKLLDEVKCLIRHSAIREIKGVPFTIIANQWAIQGAETAEKFYRAFDYAATEALKAAYPTLPNLHGAAVFSGPGTIEERIAAARAALGGMVANQTSVGGMEGVEGVAGGPSCGPKAPYVPSDSASDAASDAASTQSGTSGPVTPTNSHFGESRKALAV